MNSCVFVRVKRRSAVMNALHINPVFLRNPASETGIRNVTFTPYSTVVDPCRGWRNRRSYPFETGSIVHGELRLAFAARSDGR